MQVPNEMKQRWLCVICSWNLLRLRFWDLWAYGVTGSVIQDHSDYNASKTADESVTRVDSSVLLLHNDLNDLGWLILITTKVMHPKCAAFFKCEPLLVTLLVIRITVSSIVIGVKNSYFPPIHMPSCYWIFIGQFNKPLTFKDVV